MADVQDEGGGALGAQLDRLREVTEELHAVLAGQRSDGTTGEKWLARISSLETRLSMVESTVRAEAERVQSAARNVDALAGTLRAALEGAEAIASTGRALDGRLDRIDKALADATPDVIAIAAEVGRQVEAVVQAPTQEMTRALAEHLDRSGERERAVAGALDSLTGQLNQFTATLATEVRRSGQEAVSASKTELEGTGRQIADLTARMSGLTDLAARIDLAIAGIGAVREDLAATSSGLDQSERLDALAEATARVDARVAQTLATVGQSVRDVLVEDRAATVGPVIERLGAIDGVRNDLVGLRETLVQRIAAADATAQLDAIGAAVDELAARPAEPGVDVTPAIEQLAGQLAPVADRLEALRAHIEQLGSYTAAVVERIPADPTAALDDVSAQLVEVRHTLNRTSAATALDALREDLDRLRADLGAGTGEAFASTGAALEGLGARLDALQATVAGIGVSVDAASSQPDGAAAVVAQVQALRDELGVVAASLAAVAARPDAAATLGVHLQTLRDDVGVVAASLSSVAELPATVARLHADLEGLAAVPAALDGLGGAVEGAAVVQRRSASVVEGLQVELQSLRAEVGAAAAGSQHVGHRVDEATARLLEVAESGLAASDDVARQHADAVAARLATIDGALGALVARPGAEAALDPVLDRLAASNDAIATLLNGVESVAGLVAAVRAEVAASRSELAASAAGADERLDALGELGTAVDRLEAQGAAARERLDALVHLSGAVERLDVTLAEQAARLDGARELVAGVERIEQELSSVASSVGGVAAAQASAATGPDLERVMQAVQQVAARSLTAADLDGVLEELRAVLATAPPLTQGQLAEALTAFGSTLTAGPAPIAAADLHAATEAFRSMLESRPVAPSAETVAAAVQAIIPPAPSIDTQAIAAAVQAVIPPVPAIDTQAIAAAVQAVIPPVPAIDTQAIAAAVQAVIPPVPAIDTQAIAAAVTAGLPPSVTVDQLATGLAHLKADLADSEPGAIADALMAALPPAVTVEQLRAALTDLQAAIPAPATAADLDLLASRVTGAVSAAAAGAPSLGIDDLDSVRAGTAEDVRQVVAASTAELRSELTALHATVAELADLRPEPVALPPDPRPAIEAVAAAVAEARAELQAIAERQAAAEAAPVDTGPDDATAAQLDALGRLVHHAVRSLHLIEAATVGVSPKSERARTAATAALRDSESARRR